MEDSLMCFVKQAEKGTFYSDNVKRRYVKMS